ncbi:MAG TPA: tRNA preQ1(34) S-adenosylmethionine ribosyltransferase-isomerase QueA [Smithellaceae bacterium]|nr:tRNA preQ1(34) S-adenosylmethionine ribosyltransferase-isomerase QueA [Smithellaceae bacterium]HRS89719.1 tRNA preQ1(34) S-adenosylmethionine ribosyltransferase-isomerase QueA [Smithellaceae bacterium]HRV26853.1 tRNA preQ1(34) S-adenosylmethionine ribosyltransferase-isomerase QueA [Smithellaceae bacterium]
MKLKDFSYDLPAKLIAQEPSPQRDSSRLLLLDRKEKKLADSFFSQLPDLLISGDVLVINDSRVIPARLFGKKRTGANVEILLLAKKGGLADAQIWEVLLKPAKRMHINDVITLEHNCQAQIMERISDKKWLLKFIAPEGFEIFLRRFGRAPLPPYIRREKDNGQTAQDLERYQTVYAKKPGSVAAPTAGLHFSETVLRQLKEKSIRIAEITLHVGVGTFLPIETEDVEKHIMEEEFYEISSAAAEIINNARRVVAVGTTSTRALESATDEKGELQAGSGFTNLFIYPGYKFRKVAALLTNFHLPQSSLFLLVCAFAGNNFIKKAYRHAVEKSYRFYSYGDCMLIT